MKKLCLVLLSICMMAGLMGLIPAAGADPYAPPSNLDQLSQAEQLAYFNLVVNRVREEKPGFQQRELQKVDSMQFSNFGGIIDVLINSILRELMPGEWLERSVDAGQSNEGLFMSENANASDLRPGDIAAISCEKQGDHWVIDLRIREETNPASGLSSSNGRVSSVMTREQIVDEVVTGNGIRLDPADATIRYGSGFARVTVNEEGKVLIAANGFQVNAQFNKMRMSIITTDAVATMNAEWQYAYFDWAPEEPFPSANNFPPANPATFDPINPPLNPPLKWWQYLPPWLQWVFTYLFFAWLWMG